MLVAGLMLGCSDAGPGTTVPAADRRPDVLLVMLDTVRADHLMPYGYRRGTSYELAEMARGGVLFEDVTAPSSWTWPSHASLFTGLPPWVHGAHFDPRPGGSQVTAMRPDLPTLAETFAAAGYRTVAHCANTLLKPELGLMRGFDETHVEGDGEVVRRASRELAAPRDRPLLLFVNLISAHSPYRVAPGVPWSARLRSRLATFATLAPFVIDEEGLPALSLAARSSVGGLSLEQSVSSGAITLEAPQRQIVSDLYDGELVRLDNALDDLLRAWRESGREGIVVVTSDHGEYLGEHQLLGHGHTTFREVLQVPLVLVAAGLPAGVRISEPVQLQDLNPTLLELAHLAEHPPGSLLPIVAGGRRAGPIQAQAWRDASQRNASGPRFASGYRYFREGPRVVVLDDDGRHSYYELDSDPGMLVDLGPQRGGDLAGRATAAFPSAAPGYLSDEGQRALERELEQLGYVAP